MVPTDPSRALLMDQLRAGLAASLRLADALDLHLVGVHLDAAREALLAEPALFPPIPRHAADGASARG